MANFSARPSKFAVKTCPQPVPGHFAKWLTRPLPPAAKLPLTFLAHPSGGENPEPRATPRRQAVTNRLLSLRPSASRPQPNETRSLSQDRAVDFLRRPERSLPRQALANLAARPNNCRSKDATAGGAESLRNAANESRPPNAAPWLTFLTAWALLPLAPDARACPTRPQAHDAHARAHKPASRPLLFCDC